MRDDAAQTLHTRFVSEQSLRGERGGRLLRYLLDHGADEFSIKVMALVNTSAPFADAFEDELGPYERATAFRRVPVVGESPGGIRVRLWTFNDTSLARLLTFLDEGLFHSPAGPDGWLEDLMIYRRGTLVVGLVSHEREGVLRLTSAEHADVEAVGIPSEGTGESVAY